LEKWGIFLEGVRRVMRTAFVGVGAIGVGGVSAYAKRCLFAVSGLDGADAKDRSCS